MKWNHVCEMTEWKFCCMLNLQHVCAYDAVTAVQPIAAYLIQTFYMQNSVCYMDAVIYVYVWGT